MSSTIKGFDMASAISSFGKIDACHVFANSNGISSPYCVESETDSPSLEGTRFIQYV